MYTQKHYREVLFELQSVEYWIYNKPFEKGNEWNDELQKMLESCLQEKKKLEELLTVLNN